MSFVCNSLEKQIKPRQMRSGNSLTGAARLAAIVAPWIVVPIVALALKGGPNLSGPALFASGLFAGFLLDSRLPISASYS
jgi:hypothetical protein